MATIDHGSTVTLFLAKHLVGVKAPGQAIVHQGTLLRITLSVSASTAPKVVKETVIASGLPEQASSSAFVRGAPPASR